jgi:TonB-linked SusC/RagA family outer membrane protein
MKIKRVMKKFTLVLSCLLLSIFVGFSQTGRTITGTVLEADTGEPAIGATIMVRGMAGVGTATDINGKFSLNVPAGGTHVVVSYINYQTQELPIEAVMNIRMQPDAGMLQEVVITGIGGRVDRRMFTGATDQLDAASTMIGGIADASRSLAGLSAGVSVQNVSGTFGTAPRIRVRGATSIFGDSRPLWVVDGVVVEPLVEVSSDALSSGDPNTLISSAIAGLNADDIESFQILKDGSATSIYGARAMAGVIVITTKRGRAGHNTISYTGQFTHRLVPSYNQFNIMNSQDQMGIYQEMRDKGWLNFAETFRRSDSGVYGRMFHLINTYDPTTGFGLQNTPAAMNAYLREAEMRNTDWFDLLFNRNIEQNHSITVSGGNEKTTYHTSLSVINDPGWTLQSKMERYTGNFRVTHNILRNLTLDMNSMGSYRQQRAPGTLGQATDPVSGEVRRDFDINPYSYALNSSRALDPNVFYTSNFAPFNILHELDNNFMDVKVTDLRFQGNLRWRPIRGLEIGGLASLSYASSTNEHHAMDNSNRALAFRAMDDATVIRDNPLLYEDPDRPLSLPISVLPEGGIYTRNDVARRSLDLRATLAYSTVISDIHHVDFHGGAEINDTERSRTNFIGWGLQYSMGEIPFFLHDYFKMIREDGASYYGVQRNVSRMAGFFGSATYSYDGRYTINLTGRYEGTNQMGRSRSARWLPTWNVGLRWNVHEERFFDSFPDAISNLTFRTSYSLTGSPVPPFVSNSFVVIRSTVPWRPFADIQEPALEIRSLENSELTYEKKHEFNFGLETGFFGDRISLGFDIFHRNNFDLIGMIQTQGVGGEITKYANVADMQSQGFEISLSTLNVRTKDFSWNTVLNFGLSQTKVTRLEAQTNAINLVAGTGFTQEGFPVRSLFSFQFQGLDEYGVPTFLRENGTVSSYSDPRINFQNRHNLSEYLKYEGPTDPPITGGFINNFGYKRFSLSVRLTYSFGNVVRLDPVFSSRYNDLTSHTREFKNRWMLPGDENYTAVPTIITERDYRTNRDLTQSYNAYNFSDVRVAKGDFIRLADVSLTYQLPVENIEAIHNLSLTLQGTNLLLLYADKKLNGQDPEFFRSGGVATPMPRQFTLTLRATL